VWQLLVGNVNIPEIYGLQNATIICMNETIASLRRYYPVQVVRVRNKWIVSISAMCSPSGCLVSRTNISDKRDFVKRKDFRIKRTNR